MLKNNTFRVRDLSPFDPTLSRELEKFQSLAKGAREILISSTYTSDGDSIGGQLGLLALISKICGKSDHVTIVNHSPVPERYRFLKGSENILTVEQFRSSKMGMKKFDFGIVCDGGTERTGDVEPFFSDIQKLALVDHHAIGSERTYDARLLDLEASSTCELVYHMFDNLSLDPSKEVAESLFIGIVFDTGFFKHSLTKPRTHLVASKLLETGIDFSKISDRAILERTWEGQLLLRLLLQNMERSPSGKVVSSFWSAKELESVNPKDGDQEGMINQLYYTEGADVVVLFTEKDDGTVKISFRSKGKVNVAEFARSLDPNGGGHVRASGCSMTASLSEAKRTVLSQLDSLLGT